VKPEKKLLLAVTVLLAAASFSLSRPAVGTAKSEVSGAPAVLAAKLLGRS
jgi:hypothetical protein